MQADTVRATLFDVRDLKANRVNVTDYVKVELDFVNKGSVLLSTVSSPWAAGGVIKTTDPDGNTLLMLWNEGNGGGITVYNKTGEMIADMKADEYGNGVVGAYNRKGRKGRMLTPGP